MNYRIFNYFKYLYQKSNSRLTSAHLQKEHNETVAKLGFVLALVESIVELAQSRSSPITESVDQRQGNTFRLDHTSFVSEGQRQLEQLVLYVRALQLLSSSIELAREEVKATRLQPSNNVKTSKSEFYVMFFFVM